jgi:CRP-like cAMP-binding protein
MSLQGIFPIDNWDFKSRSILSELPPEDYALITARKRDKMYKKGEIIFYEGAVPAGIFFIADGKAKKYKLDSDGKEHIIYVANSGELVGYHAVLAEERYPDSAAALEESRISFIAREDFLWALEHSVILNRRLLKTLSHEFSVYANNLTLFAQKPVRQRLAVQLIILREKYKKNFQPGIPVAIDMTRDDLASLVGTARENIVRALTDFKKDGIVQTKGRKIMVIDVNNLITIADYK